MADSPNLTKKQRRRQRKEAKFVNFTDKSGKVTKFRVVKAKGRGAKRGTGSSSDNSPLPKEEAEFVRSYCSCQATLHVFWANCTECGYILCDAERDGECFTCGATVIKGQGTFPRDTDTLELNAKDRDWEKSRAIAIEHRDTLLKYNAESEKRTIVRSDDFWEDESTNVFLSQEERKLAKKIGQESRAKRTESRAKRGYKINLDLNNRTVEDVEEEEKELSTIKTFREMQAYNERLAKQKWKDKPEDQRGRPSEAVQSFFENNTLSGHAAEVYARLKELLDEDPEMKGNKGKMRKGRFVGELSSSEDEDFTQKKSEAPKGVHRVPRTLKDRGNETMGGDEEDKGVCLSMHQPWASLLVHGIKRVEGRTWNTEYRGRLWIAAAKRIPADFEVLEVEEQYCKVFGLTRAEIPFPKEYPTACLLGAVDLVDAKTHDEYAETKTTKEESSSDHVFLCANPRILIMPGQCSGEHKLWRIPPEKVKLFQGGLRRVDISWYPEGR